MTKQHTPGPWKLQAGRSIKTISGEFYLSYGQDRHGNPNFRNFCELDANARLIAAAPETAAERDRLKAEKAELVEALERLEDYTSRATNDLNDQDTGWYYQLIAATQKARAAIAKANS